MMTRRDAFSPSRGVTFLLAALLLAGGGIVPFYAAASDPSPEQSDINRDGTVNSEDLLAFQREWHQVFTTVGDLVPIAVGNYWRYNVSTTTYDARGPQTTEDQLSVSVLTTQNTTTFPGHKAAVLRYRLVSGSDRFIYQELVNGAYILLGEGTIYPGPAVEYDPSQLWIQGPVVPGKIWIGSAIKDTRGVPAVATASYDINSATVETPAGIFYNCTKVLRTEIGNVGGTSYQANETLWFKPGLGLVLAEYHRAWTTTPTGVTDALDEAWFLREYNIQ